MSRAVILCGLGHVGWRVLDYLRAAGVPVVAIDNGCPPDDRRLEGVRLIRGDCRDRAVLDEAGVRDATGVLILTSDDLVNISTALMVRHLHADVRVVVRMFNQNLVPRLGKAVTNVFALSTSGLTAPLLALTALTGEALGTFTLGSGRCQVAEVKFTGNSPLAGQSVAAVIARHGATALAHLRRDGDDRFLNDVDGRSPLAAGDQLVVFGEPRALAPLLSDSEEEALPHLRWAGWLRRMFRVIVRTLGEVDLSVKVCTLALLGVVLASTLVYHLGVDKSLAGGLFRTISVIATGGDMHEEELKLGWQKVFVSVLRIAGAALTAAFTAIVTNYLLRAQLGGALEIRRIPDGGHVIVCGLGNVGFRVVEELLHYGEPVVVIERARDSRFLATTRRLGVAVIVGDATVHEVLRQAHAGTARAVVVATSNELANLEIALLARELNPRQRVVVRLSDPYLAQMLREEANVGLALSIPALAAPAFVAALFGDRVQSVFLVKGQMLVAVDLVVQADEPMHGQVVQALAIDYRLLPVALTCADAALRPALLQHRLAVNDRLTVFAALPDLERLLRREPVPADWTVEVADLTRVSRLALLGWLRRQQGMIGAAVDAELPRLPVRLADHLTRGQAEVLLRELSQAGVEAQIVRG